MGVWVTNIEPPAASAVVLSNGQRNVPMEIEPNDPRNVRASGRTRPHSMEERQTQALESIAGSLATIAAQLGKSSRLK